MKQSTRELEMIAERVSRMADFHMIVQGSLTGVHVIAVRTGVRPFLVYITYVLIQHVRPVEHPATVAALMNLCAPIVDFPVSLQTRRAIHNLSTVRTLVLVRQESRHLGRRKAT